MTSVEIHTTSSKEFTESKEFTDSTLDSSTFLFMAWNLCKVELSVVVVIKSKYNMRTNVEPM